MNIGKNYKIESDSINVTISRRSLARKGKNAGQETWINEGYFANLSNALKFLADQEVKETALVDLKTIIKKQEEIYKLIRAYILDANVNPPYYGGSLGGGRIIWKNYSQGWLE